MSRKYKIWDQSQSYFVTFTVINWIDVFIRDEYRKVFVDSVQYCQSNKGLEVNGWCIMPSHIHMIIGTNGKNKLEGIIRDLKSFTSRSIRKILESKILVNESRDWMLPQMYKEGIQNSNNNDFQFWQQHNQPIEMSNLKIAVQKLEYIHLNPVAAGFVDVPEAWLHSSARDYYGTAKGLIELVLIE